MGERTARVLAGLRLTAAVVVIAVLLFSSLTAPVIGYRYTVYREVTILVPAVEETPNGFRGVLSNLTVGIAWPGSGDIYISTSPLAGMDTQASARLAILVACLYAGVDYRDYDFFIKYGAMSQVISGPSASAATAVAALAALKGYTIPRNFSMTGMIGPDGSVNPVGGVPEKLQAAAEHGVKLFIIPLGERLVVDPNTGRKVDVVELGMEMGVKVEEAASIIDVLRALGVEYPMPTAPSKPSYPGWVRDRLTAFTDQLLSLAEGNTTHAETLRLNVTDRELASIIDRYVNTSKNYVEESRELSSRGMYYSAASRAFVAAWYASVANYLAEAAVSSKPVEAITERVKSLAGAAERVTVEANKTYASTIKSAALGQLSLQLAVTLYDRVVLALEALQEVNAASTPLDALVTATYAYYRGLTALQWAEMLRESLEKEPRTIGLNDLRVAVRDYIQYTESTLTYLRSLGVSVPMNSVEKAKQLLVRDPVAAASLTVSSLSNGLTALYTAFHAGLDRLEVSSNATSLLAAVLASKNTTLLLPLFYREYAENIALKGTEEAVAQAIGLYASASSYMLLLYMLEPKRQAQQPPVTSGGKTVEKTTVVTEVTTVTVNNTVTVSKALTTTVEKTVWSTTTVTETVVKHGMDWLYPLAALVLVIAVFLALCRRTGS